MSFKALKPLDRRSLGWRALGSKTAKNWLIELPEPEVYRVVWEPLLIGKFGANITGVDLEPDCAYNTSKTIQVYGLVNNVFGARYSNYGA